MNGFRDTRIVRFSLLLTGCLCAASLHAQGAASGSRQMADLYTQMQQLQREMMQLRGVIEEQAYRIRKLERQRLADYQNLDQRLQAVGAGAGVSEPAAAAPASAATPAPAAAAAAAAPIGAVPVPVAPSAAEAEEASYKRAFRLLKQQQLPEAQAAFSQHLKDYPDGNFSANAYYWLGELHMTEDDLAAAGDAFGTLVQRYPGHRKTPEASYKLAVILQRQGRSSESKALLQRIVDEYGASSPDTVNKANAYLDKYFP